MTGVEEHKLPVDKETWYDMTVEERQKMMSEKTDSLISLMKLMAKAIRGEQTEIEMFYRNKK